MDLLITIIGNAAVDPGFRQRLLNDPLRTADEYGFHLTKGEVEMLERVFTKQAAADLERDFHSLEDTLYQNVEKPSVPYPVACKRPCVWSAYPPAQYREDKKTKAA
jgi:hypothetical protein